MELSADIYRVRYPDDEANFGIKFGARGHLYCARAAYLGVPRAKNSAFFGTFFYKIDIADFSCGDMVMVNFLVFYICLGNYQKIFGARQTLSRRARKLEKSPISKVEIPDFSKLQSNVSRCLIYGFCCGRNMLEPYAWARAHIDQINQIGLEVKKST